MTTVQGLVPKEESKSKPLNRVSVRSYPAYILLIILELDPE